MTAAMLHIASTLQWYNKKLKELKWKNEIKEFHDKITKLMINDDRVISRAEWQRNAIMKNSALRDQETLTT